MTTDLLALAAEVRAMSLRTRATHAPHRARILGLGLSVGIAIALAGCDETEMQRQRYEAAGVAANAASRVCIDGVSYLSTQVRGGYSLTPHLKADGKPYTCPASGTEARQGGDRETGLHREATTARSDAQTHPNGDPT